MDGQESCFFIGHRHAPDSVFPALCGAVLRHIRDWGVRDFVVGSFGRFDELAAGAVRAARELGEPVTLTLLLAYYDPHAALPRGFDAAFYPPGLERVPKRAAIVAANRYIVRHSSHLIAWVRHPGNSRDLLDYAPRRAERGLLHVENLAA